MSKKRFDDIEEVIRKLAESGEPAFDERAWQKMEVLLDKEKDRKKPFFWLWFLIPVMLGAGALLYYFTGNFNRQDKSKFAISNVTKTSEKFKQGKTSEEITASVSPIKADNSKQPVANPATAEGNNIASEKQVSEVLQSEKNREYVVSIHKKNAGKNYDSKAGGRNTVYHTKARKSVAIIAGSAEEESETTAKPTDHLNLHAQDSEKYGTVPKLKNDSSASEKTPVTEEKQSVAITQVSGKKKEIRVKPSLSKFYFTAAVGAEMNGLKLFSYAQPVGRAGVAAGFQFTKKLSVEAGFYLSTKKYVAGPKDYKAKAGSYWGMVDMKSIDASCRVYEVPLSVRYNLVTDKKINYFSSIALSSFFMKKEDYHYYYYRFGLPHDASASYSGNQHLFSVLRISAGAEKKISSRFALNLSPGLSVPLAGVGEGQVKLYSLDLMLGLKFMPFSKK
jgi:hypothetical protein